MPSVRAVVGICVSLLLVAILFPIAMSEIVGSNTTGWDTAVATVFTTLLAVLAVVGIAIKYIPRK